MIHIPVAAHGLEAGMSIPAGNELARVAPGFSTSFDFQAFAKFIP